MTNLVTSADEMTLSNDPPASPAFTVYDEHSAAWAADKVIAARERAERVKRQCDALVREAQQDANDTAGFFLPMLEAWARENPPRKGKTIKLPTGNLAFRSVAGGPRLVDAPAALAWARENKSDLIEVTERITITAIKGYIEASGELPDGVEIVPDREAFDVKGAA